MTQESFVAQRSDKTGFYRKKKKKKKEILTKIKSGVPASRNSAEQREGPGEHQKRGAWDRAGGPGQAAPLVRAGGSRTRFFHPVLRIEFPVWLG